MAVLLEDLRSFVGAVSTKDDDELQVALDAAISWIEERIYVASADKPEVDTATLLLASRLYKRRQSPEGTAGFGGDGVVVRVLANDPDVKALLERHQDMTRSGLG